MAYIDTTSGATIPYKATKGTTAEPYTVPMMWQASSLSFIPMQADGNGGLMVSGATSTPGVSGPLQVQVAQSTYQAASGTASSSGSIATVPSGKSPQLYYYMVNASASNSAAVTITLQFTSSATPFMTVNLVPGGVLSRNIGAGKDYLQGSVNDAIILNITGTGSVNWAVEYQGV